MNIDATELTKDSALLEELSKANTPEMIQAAFEKKGINLEVEEAQEILNRADSQDELSEDDLSNVAGGFAEIVGLICLLAFVVGFARSVNTPCDTKAKSKKSKSSRKK